MNSEQDTLINSQKQKDELGENLYDESHSSSDCEEEEGSSVGLAFTLILTAIFVVAATMYYYFYIIYNKKAVIEYEIDKMTLTTGAVHEDMVDRIYRALFVHSVGFFGMIKEATKNVKDGKAAIQANIWRVFQVLLEYACKTDYKLVTQKIEESHLN